MKLRPFVSEDAEPLAAISRRAFDHDVACGASGPGGPPGYDSPEWQIRTAAGATEYLVIEVDGVPVGGMIVFGSHGDYWLGRMFIDPGRQNLGLGAQALACLEQAHPDWFRWALETPPWNQRTRHFYEKAGYEAVGTSKSGDVLYEKCRSARKEKP